MRFKCPKCGKPLKVADDKAGKKGRCPACKAMMTVPLLNSPVSRVIAQEATYPPPLPAPDYTFEIIQETRKKETWKLSLYGDRLILHSPETDALVEVLRDQAIDKIKTGKFFFAPPFLSVKDDKRLNFRLAPETYEIIKEWIGKPVLLKAILKQRLSWCIPIGIIYMLTSLPSPGDPTAGLEAIPFDPIGMGLGGVLIGITVLSRKKPHPVFFLTDSALFFILLCYTLFQILSGASIYWGGIIVIQIIFIISGISHYRNFSDVQDA